MYFCFDCNRTAAIWYQYAILYLAYIVIRRCPFHVMTASLQIQRNRIFHVHLHYCLIQFRRFYCHLTGFFLRSLLYRNGCLAFSFCDHFSGGDTSHRCITAAPGNDSCTTLYRKFPALSSYKHNLCTADRQRTYLRSGVLFLRCLLRGCRGRFPRLRISAR